MSDSSDLLPNRELKHENAELQQRVHELLARIHELETIPLGNPNPVVEVDLTGELRFANSAATNLLQLAPATSRAYLPPDFAACVNELATTTHPVTREIVCGGRRWLQSLVLSPNRHAIRVYFVDVTRHHDSEQRAQAIIDNAPLGIVMSRQGHIVLANPELARIHGYDSPNDVIGKSIEDLVAPESREGVRNHNSRREANQAVPNTYDIVAQRRDGTTFLATVHATLISHGGQPTILAFISDITRRQAAENETRAKSEFLASLSHELRTPMMVMLNLTEALREQVYGPLNVLQLKQLSTVLNSGRHLLDLITEMLDMSRLETEQLQLQYENCDAAEIGRLAVALISPAAELKGQPVVFESTPARIHLRCDPPRLKQMLHHLLSNAVKFTPEGGKVGLRIVGNRDSNLVHFTVWDTGIGIAPDNLPRLFKMFSQLDNKLSRQYSGVGLGLALVQRLAELHSGRIEVQSAVNQGSQFTLALPWLPWRDTHYLMLRKA